MDYRDGNKSMETDKNRVCIQSSRSEQASEIKINTSLIL